MFVAMSAFESQVFKVKTFLQGNINSRGSDHCLVSRNHSLARQLIAGIGK